MKNNTDAPKADNLITYQAVSSYDTPVYPQIALRQHKHHTAQQKSLAEILVISSYPPRECGIATYSQDLIKALNNKFSNSFNIKVCALECGKSDLVYPSEVKWTLDTTRVLDYMALAEKINVDEHIQMVLIQHEFGFYKQQEQAFLHMLYEIM